MAKEVDTLYKAMQEYATARSALVAASTNKSITRHSLREHFRIQSAASGEKVTETRLDDLSVSSDKYKAVCQEEVNATLAEGQALAEVERARCAFELLKLNSKS